MKSQGGRRVLSLDTLPAGKNLDNVLLIDLLSEVALCGVFCFAELGNEVSLRVSIGPSSILSIFNRCALIPDGYGNDYACNYHPVMGFHFHCSRADSKRQAVRTIEVRPMSQQPSKQLTATVMPTTSQSEPQEPNLTVSEGAYYLLPTSSNPLAGYYWSV